MEQQNQAPINKDDPFDRQRRIENWNQELIEKQVCLLLGVGGLGCTVAMALARLGVKKIILLDKDVVDISNLNRQILFDANDLGKSKAESALLKLKQHHLASPSTQVEALTLCAVSHWKKVVELSAEATVIYNMIDVGDYFDAAVQALAMHRGIPLIQGGTFCQQLTVDMFFPGQCCLVCSADTYEKVILEKLLPSKIATLDNLDFIPRNNNPIGQSNIYLCSICGQMMVSRLVTYLINDPEVTVNPRFIMTVNNGDSFSFPIPQEENCLFCRDCKPLKAEEKEQNE